MWTILRQTFREWQEDKVPVLASSLAYYTVFSLAPLLLIVIAVAGLVFDRAQAQERILAELGGLVGQQGRELIASMLEGASRHGSGWWAGLVGVLTLVLGASGVFLQLQQALNTVWDAQPRQRGGVSALVRARLAALGMVLGLGFLVLVSLIASAALSALGTWAFAGAPGSKFLWQLVSFFFSFLVITLVFALLYKYVPDVPVTWRDVWIGAIVTALLFNLGKFLIGQYLGHSATASTFGAAGALVVLLLWIYYSAQIILLGAEFTQVYAHQRGSRAKAPQPEPAPGGPPAGP
jgi:membrane protein